MDKTKQTKIVTCLTAAIAIILLLVPFQAFLTVWPASVFGHYTAWRIWDDVVLIIAMVLSVIVLYQDRKLLKRLTSLYLVWLILGYCLLELITGLIALARHDVSLKALGYAWIVNLRYLGFFIVCLVAAAKTNWLNKRWTKLVLVPAAVVIGFGLLQQFVLPANFLSHFGYNSSTIMPYQTVNSNSHYIRLQSTLRGPNPLGAYLILIIAAVAVLIRQTTRKKNYVKHVLGYGCLLLAALIVLFFSYSRSALAGTLLSIFIILWISLKGRRSKIIIAAIVCVLVIIVGAGLVTFRNNSELQNILFHTSTNSVVKSSSDKNHYSATRQGLVDVLKQPLGRGPGTAGPASVYNNHPPRIAEDYYIQIAQEVGWLGLILFILINWFIGKKLWLDRHDALVLVVLASLIGLSLINFLSYAWSDDTLSYIWWGLAGIALGPSIIAKQHKDRQK